MTPYEQGYSGYMEKAAMNFGATKALLRQLRDSGVEVRRVRPRSTSPEFAGIQQRKNGRMMPMGESSSTDTRINVLKGPSRHLVTAPDMANLGKTRQPLTFTPNTGLGADWRKAGNPSPRASLFHEAGHLFSDKRLSQLSSHSDPRVRANSNKATQAKSYDRTLDGAATQEERRMSVQGHLVSERMANDEAIGFMRNHNVPDHLIDMYGQLRKPSCKSGFLGDKAMTMEPLTPEYANKLNDFKLSSPLRNKLTGGLHDGAITPSMLHTKPQGLIDQMVFDGRYL
jgi:hypothetical protein